MDSRKAPPEHTLDLFSDTSHVRDIVRGVLHLIFFHRYFPLIRPSTMDVLDMALPLVPVPELESVIDNRCHQLYRQLCTPSSSAPGSSSSYGSGHGSSSSSTRGSIQIKFLERTRRKSASGRGMAGLGWFGGGRGGATAGGGGGGLGGLTGAGEEEVCWEVWSLKVTLANPRTEGEKAKVMRAMETTLQKTALKIMAIANGQKEHIPPITNEQAFPYQIVLNPRVEGYGMR